MKTETKTETERERERNRRIQPVSTRPRMVGTTAKGARLPEVITPETLDTHAEVTQDPVLRTTGRGLAHLVRAPVDSNTTL